MEDNTAFWNPISSATFSHCVEMKFAQERFQDGNAPPNFIRYAYPTDMRRKTNEIWWRDPSMNSS